MKGPLANALAVRADLRNKLRRVEEFIATYKAFDSGIGPERRRAATRRVCVPGRPAEAWERIKAVLSASDTPMTRGEIVEACAKAGYQMPGARPRDYVGIIICRHKDEVITDWGRYRLRTETAQKPEQPTDINSEQTAG